MSAIIINKNNYNEEVINSDKPVLLDFWAEWCEHCQFLGPFIDQIARERKDYKVCKINVSDNPELAEQYDVSSIPTLIVIKDGKIDNRSVGGKLKSEVLSMM